MALLKFSLPLSIYILLLTACFHKSDKTGQADDVSDFLLCSAPNGDFLITHEEIFHAQSKSYNNGITQITGYSDYRYTVRDLLTGKTKTLYVTGDGQNDVVLLGYDGKNLWCYNAAKDGGVEARDPVSMQVVISRKKIEEANPELADELSTPKVYEANQFYTFDYHNRKVILTDLRGVFYAMDPLTLKSVVRDSKPKEFPDINDVTSSSASVAPGEEIRMEGDLRKKIVLNDSVKSSESFLKGEFILQSDPVHLAEMGQGFIKSVNDSSRDKRLKIDSLKKSYSFLQNEREMYRDYSHREIVDRYTDLKREVEEIERDSAGGYYKITRFLSGSALGCDSNIVYVIHANNLTDTSSIIISKMKFDNERFTTQWTILLAGIYFDPDRGIQKNPMKDVFKSGSPEFRFEQYGVKGNVLCGVKMLFAFGIDTRTGKLLWKQQL